MKKPQKLFLNAFKNILDHKNRKSFEFWSPKEFLSLHGDV
jgi:hypothetical protein